MHHYSHHIGDYRRDTMHLTLLEHGCYRQLLDLYYLNECALDANALRLICARSAEEMQAAENVLNEFFEKTENGWVHKRCEHEISNFRNKSEAAKASANARWQKKPKTDANAMRTHSEGNANHKPITSTPVNPLTPLVVGLDSDAWVRWVEYRKGIKKPLKAVSLQSAQAALAEHGTKQMAVVEQSIANGWTGLFALKENANANHRNTAADTIAAFTGQRQPAVPEGGAGIVVEGSGTRV